MRSMHVLITDLHDGLEVVHVLLSHDCLMTAISFPSKADIMPSSSVITEYRVIGSRIPMVLSTRRP